MPIKYIYVLSVYINKNPRLVNIKATCLFKRGKQIVILK